MATISINIPNAQVARVSNAMCKAGGYTGDPADNAAKNMFVKNMVKDYVIGIVRGVEQSGAWQQAMNAVNIVDADIT